MNNRFVAAIVAVLLCFLFSQVAYAQPVDVTLNNDIQWDVSEGVAGYQVKVLTSINGPHWPSNTDSNVVHDNGLSTIFDLALALTGATPGVYKVLARSVDVGGTNPTAFSTFEVNYLGFAPPQNMRVVMLNVKGTTYTFIVCPLLEFNARIDERSLSFV